MIWGTQGHRTAEGGLHAITGRESATMQDPPVEDEQEKAEGERSCPTLVPQRHLAAPLLLGHPVVPLG